MLNCRICVKRNNHGRMKTCYGARKICSKSLLYVQMARSLEYWRFLFQLEVSFGIYLGNCWLSPENSIFPQLQKPKVNLLSTCTFSSLIASPSTHSFTFNQKKCRNKVPVCIKEFLLRQISLKEIYTRNSVLD